MERRIYGYGDAVSQRHGNPGQPVAGYSTAHHHTSSIDIKVNAVIHYIADALMSPEERQIIVSTAIYRAKKLTNSAMTELILVIIVIVYSISLVKNKHSENSREEQNPGWRFSMKATRT